MNNNNNNTIVPWGTNLSSNVGSPSFGNFISNLIVLPPFQESLIIGLLLGDGCIKYAGPRSTNALFTLKHKYAHVEYLYFVFTCLWHYCKSGIRLAIGKRNNTITFGVYFVTRSLPCFTYFRHLFYPNGIKIVPQNIYHLLTPVALAHWIMGDGVHRRSGLELCTDSFTIEEVVKLINVLIIRYNLECTLQSHHGNPRIYIRSRSMPQLRAIVKQYTHPIFYYKLHI